MFFKRQKQETPPTEEIYLEELAGLNIPVLFKRSTRARRVSLKTDLKARAIILTAPIGTRTDSAARFLLENIGWIKSQATNIPQTIRFHHGAKIPVLGTLHAIHHIPQSRGVLRCQDGVITVPCQIEHLERRVTDFLKSRAREIITPLAHEKARKISKKIKSISIRDQKTRWGSCTHDGALNFSWRLVLAPEKVLDYVVAHEVAHLEHMDHSQNFWSLCEFLSPNSKENRRWLRKNTALLHSYGA